MRKRFTFQCWQCKETFELTTDIASGQVLKFFCPFCGAELVFDPSPYPTRVVDAFRGTDGSDHEELVLPDVLPTTPPEEPQDE